MTWTRHQTLQAQPLWTHTHAPTPMQPNQQPADVHKAFPSAVATAHLASCPRGKWPCRAALSNAPIYREPKEHFSASSPCQPLSRAVGWPETPSPSSFSQEGPLTLRPTPGQRCAEPGYSNQRNSMNQLNTLESREQRGQETFLDALGPMLARKYDMISLKTKGE